MIHTRMCQGRKKGRFYQYKMYKFRTMKMYADNLEKWLTPQQIEQYKNELKVDHDPRITRVGKFIRKWSIDELPQLLSILKGDMTFIGPRPVTKEELAHYGDDAYLMLNVKPGLTGYWQVNGRSNCTYESGKRQQLELFYAKNQCFVLDLRILFKTFWVVLIRRGAK